MPHIQGETLAAAAFGMGYCQAEDHLDEIMRGILGVRGESALVATAKEMGDTGLEASAPDFRLYYDRVYEEIESARALMQIRAQVVTLKRPIQKFTTSLGGFGAPVTLQLPELSVISINTTALVPLSVDEE